MTSMYPAHARHRDTLPQLGETIVGSQGLAMSSFAAEAPGQAEQRGGSHGPVGRIRGAPERHDRRGRAPLIFEQLRRIERRSAGQVAC